MYMESNQPFNSQVANEGYNRIDTNLGTSTLAGAGAAMTGAGAMDMAMRQFRQSKGMAHQAQKSEQQYNSRKDLRHAAERESPSMMGKTRGMMFGNSKFGKIARYAGYGLAGAGVGAGISLYDE